MASMKEYQEMRVGLMNDMLLMMRSAFQAGITATVLRRDELPAPDASSEEIDAFCEQLWKESRFIEGLTAAAMGPGPRAS